MQHVGSYFPDQGLNPHPLQWKHSLNHWATRKVPEITFLNACFTPRYSIKPPMHVDSIHFHKTVSYFLWHLKKLRERLSHICKVTQVGRGQAGILTQPDANSSPIFSCWKTESIICSVMSLCDPVDCSLPGRSVHGILQARILQWIAMPFSRGSSRPFCLFYIQIWAFSFSTLILGNRTFLKSCFGDVYSFIQLVRILYVPYIICDWTSHWYIPLNRIGSLP